MQKIVFLKIKIKACELSMVSSPHFYSQESIRAASLRLQFPLPRYTPLCLPSSRIALEKPVKVASVLLFVGRMWVTLGYAGVSERLSR